MKTVTVDANALHSVLGALVGPGHLIRELQATRDKPPVMVGNPIDILIKDYNAGAIAATKAPMTDAEFLTLAQSCGAVLTGKPDGSEAITLVFSIAAWRAFSTANGAVKPPPPATP